MQINSNINAGLPMLACALLLQKIFAHHIIVL